MKLNIKKLFPDSKFPERAHTYDAGMDLFAQRIVKAENNKVTYGTGIALEIPEGFVGLAFPRSSIKNTNMRLTNGVGVIDSGYQGEIFAVFDEIGGFKSDLNSLNKRFRDSINPTNLYENISTLDDSNWYKVGEKILQIVIIPIPQIELNVVEEFATISKRGINGFGSTGKTNFLEKSIWECSCSPEMTLDMKECEKNLMDGFGIFKNENVA